LVRQQPQRCHLNWSVSSNNSDGWLRRWKQWVVLEPNREDRVAAAFVAAHAYHLLDLARDIRSPRSDQRNPLRPEAISSEVSAMLLFLIANQPTDAMDIAKSVMQARPEGASVEALLIDALVALAMGRLTIIPGLVAQLTEPAENILYNVAASALYRRLLEGLALLARYLTDADRLEETNEDALAAFQAVQALAIQPLEWPDGNRAGPELIPARTVFAGPHHLSLLLSAAADYLSESALALVPTPTGTDPTIWRDLLAKIIEVRPFLWPNHAEGIRNGVLNPGISAVASFPTGAGKTAMSELKIAAILAAGGAVIYLAPTNALVNQTKASLRKTFPKTLVRESLLLDDFYAEGDELVSVPAGQIAVMTPERCLTLLSGDSGDFSSVQLVIFDECHLIHPKEAGQNRRSLDAMLVILYLNNASPRSDWLLMSAMMSNANELAGWLGKITGRMCLSLDLDWKPTRQARGCLVYDQQDLAKIGTVLSAAQREQRKTDHTLPMQPAKNVQDKLKAPPFCLFCLKQTWQSVDVRDYKLLRLLDVSVPLSVGRTHDKRRWYPNANKNEVAAHLAAQCVRIGMKVLLFAQDTRFVMAISDKINNLLDEKLDENKLPDRCKKLIGLLLDEAGSKDVLLVPTGRAACHHGLMLPAEREVTEFLFREPSYVDAIAATPTLAQGMNFPADIVFVVGDERFDSTSQESSPLEAHEILNAAGRAGRAGHVAQGIVVVLPHVPVGFDVSTNTVGQGWMRLQQAVFSQGDQCLPLRDPIGHVLDLIQDAKNNSDPEVVYFLRRIPPPSQNDPDAPRKFLRSSLAAYHAKQRGESLRFEKLIDNALQRRTQLLAGPVVETWRDNLAYRTGIAVDFIEALHSELLRVFENPPDSTQGWVKWFFDWLGQNDRVITVLGHRLPPGLSDMNQKQLFGGKLTEIVWAWMCGETLLQLDTRLGGKRDKPGRCLAARKFILRLVPELAFAIGLAPRVRRRQIEEEGSGEMPVSLATAAWCLREGVSQPELLALQIMRKDNRTSRQKLQSLWTHVEPYIDPGRENETFHETRRRVNRGVERWMRATEDPAQGK